MAARLQHNLTVALPFCQLTLKAATPRNPWYPEQLETVGDHIRKKRLDDGLLQRELAEILGVEKTTVSSWERNRVAPSTGYGPSIVGFLGYAPIDPGCSLPAQLKAYRWVHGISQLVLVRRLGLVNK